MVTEDYEHLEQDSLDRRIELEQRKIRESASKREKRRLRPLGRRPETVFRRRVIDASKVAVKTLICGTLFLLVVHQFPTYFGGLIDFMDRVWGWIWSFIYN